MNGQQLQQVWIPYCGAAPSPSELLGRWNFDPAMLAVLAGFSIGWGATLLRHKGGQPIPFAAALAVLAFLFVSPFCALTSALFAARTAHHVVLIAVAAPLLAWSLPPQLLERRLSVGFCTAAGVVILWAWHIPGLYESALSSDLFYWVMQASLLASAIAFWIAVRQASMPAAIAALLASMVQMGLLGAILTFIPTALYAPHLLTTAIWGYSPVEDQQLGGLIMSAPAAALYLFAALTVAARWLNEERRATM